MGHLRLLFLLFFSFTCEAAAPATHVAFAQLWQSGYPVEDSHLFIAGTLFPDIRYLGTIPRNKTHEKGLSSKKIRKTASSFKAGMRLHAFLDEKREVFVSNSGILSELKEIPKDMRVFFLKLVEDEIIWDQVDFNHVRQSLGIVFEEEIAIVDVETVIAWNQSLLRYFEQKPSDYFELLIENNESFIHLEPKTLDQWKTLLPLYARNPKFTRYMDRLTAYLMMHFSEPVKHAECDLKATL
jgi:hypothetical protein